MVIVGPSGCGKTSLLMMMAGLRHQTEGTILCHGRPIPDARSRRASASSSRRRACFPGSPRSTTSSFPLSLRGTPREERRRRSQAMLSAGRPRGLRRALPARAVGRHEAARVDRPRPGAGPAGAADGRAVRRARRADAHDHGPRAAAHLVDHAQDGGVHHPQPDRGGLSRRRGAGDVGAARPDHRPHRGRRCRGRAPTR